jgi:predicted MFS family arabinose efflux permease
LRDSLRGARWALLFGNFAIGCGVMVVPGTLNDLSQSLEVSVSLSGQLISIAGVVIGFGAPLVAGWVAGFDRRRLLALALLWFAIGHALCALMPNYPALLALRVLTVFGAAVFTPQAAAAVGHMAQPAQRAQAIMFIYLGWSVASVFGMPMNAWVGETFGWRAAFGMIALLSAVAAAWTFAALPDGVKPAALTARAWRDVLTHPLLMAMVLVTALQSAGQFTLFSYLAPYYRQVLDATPTQSSLLFGWFGVFGLIGNVLLTRHIGRFGAARAVGFTIAMMALSLLLWPMAVSVVATALVLVPWALGCFATNSAQQARLGHAAPTLAPALMALNTSAIYLGQSAGAAGGGWLIAHGGFAPLHWVGLGWLAAAIALSLWAGSRSDPVASRQATS